MATRAITEVRRSARWGREVKTLRHALREFIRRSSPWVIGGGIVGLAAVRIAVGDVSWRDAVAVGAMLVVYPFGEWAIHVFLLHQKPVEIRGRRI
jgi:hypothetical protein